MKYYVEFTDGQRFEYNTEGKDQMSYEAIARAMAYRATADRFLDAYTSKQEPRVKPKLAVLILDEF